MKRRANYGIDAPGVLVAHVVLGCLFACAAVVGLAFPRQIHLPASISAGFGVVAAVFLLFAAIMLWSSLAGKLRVRDRLVDALALTGNERVLDAGCGRGLGLIGCAKQLSTGSVVGVDLWAAKDLSNNNREAALINAEAEAVADRVEIQTADITKLPFSDAVFDAVISMTVIHNIPAREGRDQALRELVRVLKPGGRIALFDLLHTSRYVAVLQAAGMTVQELSRDRLWLMPCRSLLARKP